MTEGDVAALAEHVDEVGNLGQRGKVGIGRVAEDLVGVRVDEMYPVVPPTGPCAMTCGRSCSHPSSDCW